MKLLVIRFSSIGDIVLTTPVVRCLALQKKYEIHFLTKKSFIAVLSHNPYIKKVWLWEDADTEIINLLRTEKFDAIIDLHNNLRSLKVAWLLGVKRFTFNKLNLQKWLLVKFKLDYLPKVHIVDRYLAATKKFGVTNDGGGLNFFIAPENEIDIQNIFNNSQLTVLNSPCSTLSAQITSLNCLVIGAAHATKRLPTHKLVALIKHIHQPLILLGGKDDVHVAEEIMVALNRTDIINACGKLNLQQSASVIQQSDYVITHDTGLMHIAAAFNKKIISIWGNTVPEFGMYPYLKSEKQQQFANHAIFEIKNLPCRPCSKIGFNTCPKGHFACMEQQDLIAIAEAIPLEPID